MNRFEIKQMLLDMGVKRELVEMPAILEQIHIEFCDVSIENARKNTRIAVRDNGNFSFGNAVISLDENGGATIIDGDLVIKTNEYGMEIAELDGESFGQFNNSRRKDGKILNRSGNSMEKKLTEVITADTGHWSIASSNKNKKHTLIIRKDYAGDEETLIPEIKPEEILADFEYNASTITQNYPKTAEFFDVLRENLKKSLDRQTDPLQVEMAKNVDNQKQIEKLQDEKRQLADSLEKSNGMLSEALKFMEKVRNHPIGKIFFSKDAKEFEKNKSRLYSGNEEREEYR